LSLFNVKKSISQGLFVGHPISSIYGYKTDGLFKNQQDIDNYAKQLFATKPGYHRYEDISGPDGKRDGKVTPQYDRTIIGNTFPKYSYGLTLSANYKGFDLHAVFSGNGGYEKKLTQDQMAFHNEGDIQTWVVKDHWTKDNPKRYAAYPRLTEFSGGPPWSDELTYWLRNGNYLSIRSIELGYSIPQKLLSNIFVNHIRVYVSGQNLKTFDNFVPGYNPEMTTTGTEGSFYYPLLRKVIFGLNIKF
jgi:hypothetical protein